jgi:hypothetical protein
MRLRPLPATRSSFCRHAGLLQRSVRPTTLSRRCAPNSIGTASIPPISGRLPRQSNFSAHIGTLERSWCNNEHEMLQRLRPYYVLDLAPPVPPPSSEMMSCQTESCWLRSSK